VAGPGDGRGHLSRALAIAEALGQFGATLELELVRGELSAIERRRATDLGVNVGVPGTAATDQLAPDVVVLDVPDPSVLAGRFDPERLALFDDGGTFAGRAAIVVQPSLPGWTGTGSAAQVLAGFQYAPIGATYRRLRTAGLDRSAGSGAGIAQDRARIVLCFGGSDPADVLGRVGPSLAEAPEWAVETIVGADYRGSASAWQSPVVRDPADLPERIAEADLVVIGAGTMKFEVACLGRPALLLAVADDQLAGAPVYARTGAAVYLGDGRSVEPDEVRAAVASLLADDQGRSAIGRRAARLIDGLGADRIAEAIMTLATEVTVGG
jgi:spore coat polysaccharide biosynthesis predicted glycosyltransferase SpsG